MDGNMTDRKHSLTDSLCKNIDEVVTIYTECHCFTGLLCCITCGVVKLVTKQCCGCRSCSCFGNLTIIPICEIVAVTFCNCN